MSDATSILPAALTAVVMTHQELMSNNDQDPMEYPIDGTLDLHQFRPREIKAAVSDYIDGCLEKKVYALRIIHGKGIGIQREIVQALLKKHPAVLSFRHEEAAGGWGATVVDLVRPNRRGICK